MSFSVVRYLQAQKWLSEGRWYALTYVTASNNDADANAIMHMLIDSADHRSIFLFPDLFLDNHQNSFSIFIFFCINISINISISTIMNISHSLLMVLIPSWLQTIQISKVDHADMKNPKWNLHKLSDLPYLSNLQNEQFPTKNKSFFYKKMNLFLTYYPCKLQK